MAPLFKCLATVALTLAATAAAAPSAASSSSTKPLTRYAKPHRSAGGRSDCYSGLVQVPIAATGVKLLIPEPANQTVVTEYIQELTQSNPTIGATAVGGPQAITGTYKIDYTVCFPSNYSAKVPTIQLLTHGIGLEKSYWDIAPGYSYVDAATAAGYITVAYNRLGVGQSDHPDPLQVVQATADVEIQHGLTSIIARESQGAHIVAVGHSYGSIVVLAQVGKYPADAKAIVLTGFVSQVEFLPQTVLANNPVIAAQNDRNRWGSLPTGYLTDDTSVSYQLPFWRFPYFDNKIFQLQYNKKDVYSLGQQFTLPSIFSPAATYTGPVDVVVGQRDYPFCHGDCNYPVDQAAATRPVLFPASNAASSQSYIVPNSGHIINGHYNASLAFNQINSFLKANSL